MHFSKINAFSVCVSFCVSYHKCIDHGAEYGLQQQKHGAYWTLVSDDAMAVADGCLGLNGEEESGDETINIIHTWCPCVVF